MPILRLLSLNKYRNEVEAGLVVKEEDWLYSSVTDYIGGKGLLDIIQLEPLII